MSARFFQFLFCLIFLVSHVLQSQNYRNQQGFFLGGGVSEPGRYSRFFLANPEAETRQDPAFSWEAGFLMIRRVIPVMAFSQGICVQMLAKSYHRNRELWINTPNDSIYFTSNQQKQDAYFVSFPFRWSFYLNQNSSGRWFAGPGISLSIPVYESHKIRGSDVQGVYREESRQGWPQKGPYAFVCPELETGYLLEFPDCSILRFSLFFHVRAIGLFKNEENFELQYFSGMRFAWFWGSS